MKRDVHLEATYPHPPELVWRVLTERGHLGEWLMENDFVPELGARFQFRTEPQPGFDGIVHCQVLEIEPERRMTWSWKGGPLDTRVTFTLEPVTAYSGLHTKLSIDHTGFEGPAAVAVSFIMGRGWGKMKNVLIPELLRRLAQGVSVRGVSEMCDDERSRWHFFARVFRPIAARLGRRAS